MHGPTHTILCSLLPSTYQTTYLCRSPGMRQTPGRLAQNTLQATTSRALDIACHDTYSMIQTHQIVIIIITRATNGHEGVGKGGRANASGYDLIALRRLADGECRIRFPVGRNLGGTWYCNWEETLGLDNCGCVHIGCCVVIDPWHLFKDTYLMYLGKLPVTVLSA